MYELIFLLNEETELEQIKKLVESLGGKLIKEDNWGKKTLSYSIKKNHHANFYNWSLNLNKDKINELRKKLNFNEKIIRYLLLIKE